MYESKNSPLITIEQFIIRQLKHVLYALIIIIVITAIGVIGNMWFENISLHDAILNISLIVAGIGPFILPDSVGGKMFFSLYGVFVGLVLMATLGVVLAPLAHRLLHKFHLDQQEEQDD